MTYAEDTNCDTAIFPLRHKSLQERAGRERRDRAPNGARSTAMSSLRQVYKASNIQTLDFFSTHSLEYAWRTNGTLTLCAQNVYCFQRGYTLKKICQHPWKVSGGGGVSEHLSTTCVLKKNHCTFFYTTLWFYIINTIFYNKSKD